MSHFPLNHHLRPLYRALAGLTGIFLLVFGVVGFARTAGTELFAQDRDLTALGLTTNRAFAVLSVLAGLLVLGAAVLGRNVDRWVNLWVGPGFLIAGTAMLALLNTDANFLNSSVATAIVSYVIGLVLLTAGLYGKVGSAEDAHAEEEFRIGAR
jgi:Domain of unknown function (DUF4383)